MFSALQGEDGSKEEITISGIRSLVSTGLGASGSTKDSFMFPLSKAFPPSECKEKLERVMCRGANLGKHRSRGREESVPYTNREELDGLIASLVLPNFPWINISFSPAMRRADSFGKKMCFLAKCIFPENKVCICKKWGAKCSFQRSDNV